MRSAASTLLGFSCVAALVGVAGCSGGGGGSSTPPPSLAPGVDLTGTYVGERTLVGILGCAIAGIPPIGIAMPRTFEVVHDVDTGAITLDPGTALQVDGYLLGNTADLARVDAGPVSGGMTETRVLLEFSFDGSSFVGGRVATVIPSTPTCMERWAESGMR